MPLPFSHAITAIDATSCLLCAILTPAPLFFFLLYTLATRTPTGRFYMVSLARKIQAMSDKVDLRRLCPAKPTGERAQQSSENHAPQDEHKDDDEDEDKDEDKDAAAVAVAVAAADVGVDVDEDEDEDEEEDGGIALNLTPAAPRPAVFKIHPVVFKFNPVLSIATPSPFHHAIPENIIGIKRRRPAPSPSHELVLLRELRMEGWARMEARMKDARVEDGVEDGVEDARVEGLLRGQEDGSEV